MKCKNYDSVDLFKFIGSFLVVSIHTNIFLSISKDFNWYFVNMFSRIAVYFFFVASAYFFFKGIKFQNGKIEKCKDNTKKLGKYFFRMLLLYIVWSFIYMLSDIPIWYEQNCLTIKNFIGFGINCFVKSSHYHLWFLLSLVYAIPMLYFLLRFIKIKHILFVSVFLYVIGLLYGEFSFIGLPFQDLWNLLIDKVPRFITVIFYVIPICAFSIKCDLLNFGKTKVVLLLIMSFILFSAEGILMYFYFPENVTSYNIFMIPTVVFLFVTVKSVPINLKHSYIIRKLSTLIYCIHPLVMWALRYIYDFNTVNSMLYFFVVSIISAVLGLIIIALDKKVPFLRYLS